jgi:hypothetical protein
MTEIRSRPWRELYGLTDDDAERRVDAAVAVIRGVSNIHPISCHFSGGGFDERFRETKLVISTATMKAKKPFEPDHIGFIGYVFTALEFVRANYSDTEKVDFVVEAKKGITDHVGEFFRTMPTVLNDLYGPNIAALWGSIIPAENTERVPLQAADVLCWHLQRVEAGEPGCLDSRRHGKLTSLVGTRHEWSNADFEKLKHRFEEANGGQR